MPGLYSHFESVRVDLIDFDDSRNVRQTSGLSEESLEEFAARMGAEGQIHPIALRGPDPQTGRYTGICGSRRHKASRILGWEAIWAGILRPEITNHQAVMLHHLENIDRVNLNSYEAAMAARQLTEGQEGTMTLYDYCQRTGQNHTTLSQNVQYTRGLAKEILDDWRMGHPLLNSKNLARLYALPRADSITAWAQWKAWHAGGAPEGARPSSMPKNPYKRPTPRKLIEAHEEIESMELPVHVKSFALGLVEFAQGVRKDIPKYVISSAPSKSRPPTKKTAAKKKAKRGTK